MLSLLCLDTNFSLESFLQTLHHSNWPFDDAGKGKGGAQACWCSLELGRCHSINTASASGSGILTMMGASVMTNCGEPQCSCSTRKPQARSTDDLPIVSGRREHDPRITPTGALWKKPRSPSALRPQAFYPPPLRFYIHGNSPRIRPQWHNCKRQILNVHKPQPECAKVSNNCIW